MACMVGGGAEQPALAVLNSNALGGRHYLQNPCVEHHSLGVCVSGVGDVPHDAMAKAETM